MNVDSTKKAQSNEELPAAQSSLDSDQIATDETLGNEIATVITEANRSSALSTSLGKRLLTEGEQGTSIYRQITNYDG